MTGVFSFSVFLLLFISLTNCSRAHDGETILKMAKQAASQSVPSTFAPPPSAVSAWRVSHGGFSLSCPLAGRLVSVDFIPAKKNQTLLKISSILPVGQPQITTITIDQTIFSWDAALDCADKLYLGWIEGEGGEKIRLITWDVTKDLQTLASRTVYEQAWGLHMLALARHNKTDTLLVAWQDISASDPHLLRLASLSGDTLSAPQVAFSFDPWEKSMPAFHRAGDQLVLALQTGQRFGALSHAGEPALALAYFDAAARIASYRYLVTPSGATGVILNADKVYFHDATQKLRSIAAEKLIDLYKSR